MTDENKRSDHESSADRRTARVPDLTRRRFTKAGAAAPLIMTLASRPVWGGECLTPSGHHSGDAGSARADGRHEATGSAGHSVGYWLNRPSLWLTSATPTVFEVVSPEDAKGRTVTIFRPDPDGLWERLAKGEDNVEAQHAAAILNANSGIDFGYGADEIAALNLGDEFVYPFLRCLNSRSGDDEQVSPFKVSKVRKAKGPKRRGLQELPEPAVEAQARAQGQGLALGLGQDGEDQCLAVPSDLEFIALADDPSGADGYCVSDVIEMLSSAENCGQGAGVGTKPKSKD